MTRIALAVDIGGTKMEAALVREDGALIEGSRSRAATGRAATPDSLAAAVDDVVSAALAAWPGGGAELGGDGAEFAGGGAEVAVAGTEFAGVGVGSAGPVDRAAGIITPVNMPDAQGFAVVDAVRAAVRAHAPAGVQGAASDVPVVLGHDGGALALAESWLGAVREAHSSLSIVVSTGIGGGFVVGGQRMPGATGNAGHLGQVRRDGVTLEELAAGPGSVRWAQQHGWSGTSGEDLARDAAAGDSMARAAIERSATLVGQALADAATLLDLDVVAIGGGFSRVSEDYVELVQRALSAHAVHPYSQRTRVVRSALGDEGPLIGAAALVLR